MSGFRFQVVELNSLKNPVHNLTPDTCNLVGLFCGDLYECLESERQQFINDAKVGGQDKTDANDKGGVGDGLFLRGPGHLLQLVPRFKEIPNNAVIRKAQHNRVLKSPHPGTRMAK